MSDGIGVIIWHDGAQMYFGKTAVQAVWLKMRLKPVSINNKSVTMTDWQGVNNVFKIMLVLITL